METTTQTIVAQVEVPVKESRWNIFWQRMNGNKTMILSIIFGVVQACPIPEPYKSIALSLLGAAGVKTGYDHVVKNSAFKRSIKGIIIKH